MLMSGRVRFFLSEVLETSKLDFKAKLNFAIFFGDGSLHAI